VRHLRVAAARARAPPAGPPLAALPPHTTLRARNCISASPPRPLPAAGARVNRETLSPFDMTVYKGAKAPGQPQDIAYRSEAEEMAFSVHIKTERLTADRA
jgi:hypothetical protein